jgi:hypothetical protein
MPPSGVDHRAPDKPRPRLEAEILILRHQLNVLQQRMPRRRMHLRWIDRALFIWLYRRYPRILDALSIVRPETVVRWHRKGFTGYWRWKSRSPGGRPRIAREVRDLIRRMSFENSLRGATKIHGELLKLGIAVAQSTDTEKWDLLRDIPDGLRLVLLPRGSERQHSAGCTPDRTGLQLKIPS